MIPYPRKVEQGKALIVSNFLKGTVTVSFTGMLVVPILHKVEEMDISVKTIVIDRTGGEGLICRDNIRADIKVTFFVRVNKTTEDVIKVAQGLGCDRASSQETLEELFVSKFSEALKTAGKRLDFEDLYTKRNEFRDMIIEVIGTDLNGYSLEDCAIDYLEQTPLEKLDRDNILDAQGIRKITDLTATQHIATNDFRRNEEKQIKKQDVEAAEAIYEMERQQADAKSRQQREIESVRAREQAETLKIQAEERLKAETARLKSDESIAIQEENLKREVEVATKNRERVVAVETERVEKDRLLEVISRDRETSLQTIAKDKEVEHEKRDIANVVRERVAVDKTVAEEEEAIKRLRVVEEAKRSKEAAIISAEAEAQENLVKDIKAAEASEQAAKFAAKEKLTLANADLEAADKDAQAKIRMAEGAKAEAAAAGLAEVQVKEADAEAIEKVGLAQVRVKEADAEALRKVGYAEAEVKEKDAEATRTMGTSEADVLRLRGLAEAESIREKLRGEASGLEAKAAAMKALDERSRQHEEYRLRLEVEKEVELKAIDVRQRVAEAQANLVATGLENANIDIVGGESIFFDRLVNSISAGKSADAFVDKSDTSRKLLAGYLEGDRSFAEDLKDVLQNPSIGSGDVANLTLASFLSHLIGKADAPHQAPLQQLLDAARHLGLEDKRLGDLAGDE
ncbi:MAG: SPFH domain-containing protein [Acidobacteriota bacterium]